MSRRIDSQNESSAREAVEAVWQEEHARLPRMEKDTFVRNKILGDEFSLEDLADWVMANSDLHGRVLESGCTSVTNFHVENHPDGSSTWSSDLSKPHIKLHASIEIVVPPEATPDCSCHCGWCS